MKKLILLTTLLIMSFWALVGQPTTVKWTGGNYYSKTTFDQQYGLYGHGAGSFKIALEKDGNYLYGSDALTELQKPIWGDNQNQVFADILPVLTPDIGNPTLIISNYTSMNTPPTEPGLYIMRKLADPTPGHETYWYSSSIPLGTVQFGVAFGFDYWKPADLPDSYSIPNPEYVANQALRSQQTAEYQQICQQTLTLMGKYAFPALPCKGSKTYKWWIKYEDDSSLVSIPVDCNYWLAISNMTGGNKFLYRPVPNTEISTGTYPTNVYNSQWNVRVQLSIGLTGEARIRKLIGIN
jgi:hypothetical protein